jgi:hypothetical protein
MISICPTVAAVLAMPEHDAGGAASSESESESTILLAPDSDSENAGYTSIERVTAEQSTWEQNETTHQDSTSRGVLAIISLLLIGVFISNADGTLVLATYGTISSEFDAFGQGSWLTTSYALATCAVQPIVGKLSDIYGRKGVLLASYGLFAIGSVSW